jgi:hypothetical protein
MMFIVVLKLKIEHPVLQMGSKCQTLLTQLLPHHVYSMLLASCVFHLIILLE